ncbi:MAG TPA: M56 family metallopeptidase [Thermodesulfovibrionales bacterium]|nr:M56 family metallopeptidase [Thermodesulfovibrionales bacterium]
MNLSNFFNSYMGMYIAQAFSHSLIAALVVDRAIHAWNITNPVVKQRFSLIVMIFPIFSFPLYQVVNPERGSPFFRLDTLFDINRWLNIELWGKVPLTLLFILMLAGAAMIFFVQEMIPLVRHLLESKKFRSEEDDGKEKTHDNPAIDKVLRDFPGEKPHISLIDDDDFIIYSTTGKDPAIFLSTGLINTLNTDEIEAAVAHELAHIKRSKRPLLVLAYIIRILMFFNPVVLVEFRRIVQEEEKICDDIAVSLTRKHSALAETLKKFSHKREEIKLDRVKDLSTLGSSLEDYSHSVHMENRIKRLDAGWSLPAGGEWMKFLLTLSAITAMNYFVV